MRPLRSFATSLLRARTTSRTTATLTKLPPTGQPLEEEALADYDPNHFCHIAPGDVVADGRYSIIAKLGWGRSSTVWLAKDLERRNREAPPYVSIKFNNCNVDYESIARERALLDRLAKTDPDHWGHSIIRKATDTFDLNTDRGTHLCLVYEPLRETLNTYRRRFPGSCLPLPLLRAFVKILLIGFDYVHATCGVIHTDLKLDNVLVTFENESVLHEEAEQLQDADFAFKQSSGRRIFQSHPGFGPMRSLIAKPIIADFGLAVRTDFGAYLIQPDAYRAPEVLLGWGWTASADIWNLGNLVWKLASASDLFASFHSSDGRYDAVRHLAQMSEILGPPEPALVRWRSQRESIWSPPIGNETGELCTDASLFYGGPFFDAASGEFLHRDTVQSPRSLHDLATFVSGEEKILFIDFLRKMLAWDPEQRLSAAELLSHPWLEVDEGYPEK